MANIKDLAKYCGVSISTVSYALNGSKEVSEETRERIKKAAKELNYVPNAFARNLKRKQTYNIGVILSGFDGPIHHKLLSGIAHTLEYTHSKYNMIVTLSDKKMLIVKEKGVDLAIIMDSKANEKLIKDISKIVPIITFDYEINGENIYNTTIDNMKGIYDAAKRLINKGLTKIAFMHGSNTSCHNRERYNGYARALEDSCIPLENELIFNADSFTEIDGYNLMNRILEKGKPSFEALICANDELAIGCMNSIKEHGYKIPEDIKVGGFDNVEKGIYFNPSLSTVSVDWVNYGERIGRLALDILEQKQVSDIKQNVEIIERDSTRVS